VITDLISFSERLCSLLLDQKGFFSPVDIKPKTDSVVASLNDAANWEKRREELKTQFDSLHNFLNYLNGGTSQTTPVLSPSHPAESILTPLISLLGINNVTMRP
jgi:hypothetical protein